MVGGARPAPTASVGRDSAVLWRIDRSTTRTFKIFRSARVLGLHSSWTAAINYASTVHGPCCTGMRLNANYQLNAAADAVIIVYELAKRAGNPPRRVRPRRTCSAGSHELRATVWRRSVPTTRGGESQGSEHMAVTSASGGNALSISLAQVEADFDPHVAARAPSIDVEGSEAATSRVVRRRQTCLSPSRIRQATAWSGCASRQLQRTMCVDGSPAVSQDHPRCSLP